MSKPIVTYDPIYPVEIYLGVGAYVKPIDHPDSKHVSNEKMIFTSPVIKDDGEGCFETQNTIYVPKTSKKDLN